MQNFTTCTSCPLRIGGTNNLSRRGPGEGPAYVLSSHGQRWFPGAVEHFGKWLSLEIRAALDAGKPVVVEVEHRGFTPDGELRHPVIRGWEID